MLPFGTRHAIRQEYIHGYLLVAIAAKHDLTVAEVKEVVKDIRGQRTGERPNRAAPLSLRDHAREMVKRGHPAHVVEAVFGKESMR